MKIVFMGTPDFAVGILDKLVQENCRVVGVITAPDKPAGRGQQLSESAVKKYAVEKGLHVLQPEKLKDEQFISDLRALEADLFVVVAFRMLPEVVWNMPPKGTINLHASLLPEYRGAAPINWAIINGETKTGVTTFFIEQEIDTGLVIERDETPIRENETAGELHDKLLEIGKKLVFSSVQKIENGSVKRIPQAELTPEGEIKSAPKIFKPMCRVDWSQPVTVAHNLCRGLSPYPTAWTMLKNKETGEERSLKIFRTEKTDQPSTAELKSSKTELLIPCADFYLSVSELQFEGKKRMSARDFLLGFQPEKWIVVNVE
ncbi:MAG: methionyl-tRNA formyltransferase [Crocinitomicaceae bacterium]|jgi:methionyl-tRNA formyltransferase|nr:methionyl-tRNA formyltransferase [Crocinitomicaceae bacterium]